MFKKLNIFCALMIFISLAHPGKALADETDGILGLPQEILYAIISKLDDNSVVSLARTCQQMNFATQENRLQRCETKRMAATCKMVYELKDIRNAVWETFGSLWPFMRGFGPAQPQLTQDLVLRVVADFLASKDTTKNVRELYLERLCIELKSAIQPSETRTLDGFLYPDYQYSQTDEDSLNSLTQRRNEAWTCYLGSVASCNALMKLQNEDVDCTTILQMLSSLKPNDF